jgi:hypothetical protein
MATFRLTNLTNKSHWFFAFSSDLHGRYRSIGKGFLFGAILRASYILQLRRKSLTTTAPMDIIPVEIADRLQQRDLKKLLTLTLPFCASMILMDMGQDIRIGGCRNRR